MTGEHRMIHSPPASPRRPLAGSVGRQSDTISAPWTGSKNAQKEDRGGPRQTGIAFGAIIERSFSGLRCTHVAEEHAALRLVLLRRLYDGDRHRARIDLVVLHHR